MRANANSLDFGVGFLQCLQHEVESYRSNAHGAMPIGHEGAIDERTLMHVILTALHH